MEIEKAFKRLLVKHPFYGLFCLSLPKEVTTKIDTLCILREGINCKLCINPDFWEQHSDDEQIALLMHELSHICLQHMFLSDSFSNPTVFNIAADAEVNSYISNLPKDAVTPAFLSQKYGITLEEGMGTKNYYEAIVNSQNSNSQSQSSMPQSSSSTPSRAPSGGSPQEEGTPPPSPQREPQKGSDEKEEKDKQYPEECAGECTIMDNHDSWKGFKNMPEATQQLMVNNIHNILKQTAEQVEKMHGTIPGEFSELIYKLRQKKPEVFNWKAYFRRLIGSIYDVNIRSTRRKESKRFDGAAGIQHKKKVSILVAVDTSGSVSNNELQDFFNEIDYVYKAGARITVIECDTRINSITEYDGNNIPEIKGRGGTNFNPPVEYYIQHKKEYASLIYFTDGEAPLPDNSPNGLIWVISSIGLHQDYPGKTIYIPQNNN